jgi:spore germination cell wall hydrolase CwlJ-like protein
MVASRNRPKGVRVGPFGLSILALSLVPTAVGYQDLGALLAHQPEVTQRWRSHVLASPFGTIHAATFSFPRPVGTAIPDSPVRLASLNLRDPDVTGSIARDFDPPLPRPRPEVVPYPTVNRRLKGDLLAVRPPREKEPAGSRERTPGTPGKVKTVSFPRPAEQPTAAEPAQETAPPLDGTLSAPERDGERIQQTPAVAASPPPDTAAAASANPLLDPIDDSNPTARLAQLYFGANPVGEGIGEIQPWPADKELVVVPPRTDPDLKRMTLASLPPDGPGESLAPKGEVTGVGQRPKTPAERLGLDVRQRAKAEKCLAEAVYFESRGESKRGQIAVAQVVMNRVFSGFYPGDVCGVVYQNAHRHLSCQFTFACDGVKDVVTEPDMWAQARQIARDTLDGKIWLPEIGKSTHYHAYWVHPWWVGTMRKLSKIGVHTFYRPRRWGDGAEAPAWGPVPEPKDETAKM